MPDITPGAQYENGCCDHGWMHLCGGPHDTVLEEQDVPVYDPETGDPTGETTRGLVSVYPEGHVPERPADQGGCQTVRCTLHCSCFAPDGIRPADQGGCQTVRCTLHCSCFAPDGIHDEECALNG